MPSLRITDVIGSVACEVRAHTSTHTRTHTVGGNLTPCTPTYSLTTRKPIAVGVGWCEVVSIDGRRPHAGVCGLTHASQAAYCERERCSLTYPLGVGR